MLTLTRKQRERISRSPLIQSLQTNLSDKHALTAAIARRQGQLIEKYWQAQIAEDLAWTSERVDRVASMFGIPIPPTLPLREAILAYIGSHPRSSTLAIAEAIAPNVNPANVRDCLKRMEQKALVVCVARTIRNEKVWAVPQ